MTAEQKEFGRELADLSSGRNPAGRRSLTDALRNSKPVNDMRIQPFFKGMEDVVEAADRIATTIDRPTVFFGNIDVRRAIEQILHIKSRQAVQNTFVDTAIVAMFSMETGANLISLLIQEENARSGFVHLGQLTWEGLKAQKDYKGRLPPLTNILLGDQNTQSLMRLAMGPYRQAIALSIRAMSLDVASERYSKSSDAALNIANKTAKKIRPEGTAARITELNYVVAQIKVEQQRLMASLSDLNNATLNIGVEKLNPRVVEGLLHDAKQSGGESEKLRKLLKKRENLAKEIRAQMALASRVHLAAINGIDMSALAQWASNLAVVGETVARLAVVNTALNSAAMAGVALKGATQYLLQGRINQEELDAYAQQRFSASDKYKSLPTTAQQAPNLTHFE